jgi:hypothetical protein
VRVRLLYAVDGGHLDATYDAALEIFCTKGPEFGPGLSNHGPMASDALVALGRADAVERWAAWYAGHLQEPVEARNPISTSEWREALGDIRRAGDWSVFFRAELEEQPWTEVLEGWAPRLAPGVMAGATHGILRTAHAVRALSRAANEQRLRELAEGLAYWAARYQVLPGAEAMPGELPVDVAISRVTPSDRPGAGLIFEAVGRLDASEFAPVINYVDAGRDVDAFVSDMTRSFVRRYMENAPHATIAFVHTVTAPSALRILAPYLSDTSRRALQRYMWQACAAIYATYARPSPITPASSASIDPADVDRADLADRAVAARDEHAIKFTEACLREFDRTGDAQFIVAADDALTRLRAR